jgi:hypothetical protein
LVWGLAYGLSIVASLREREIGVGDWQVPCQTQRQRTAPTPAKLIWREAIRAREARPGHVANTRHENRGRRGKLAREGREPLLDAGITETDLPNEIVSMLANLGLQAGGQPIAGGHAKPSPLNGQVESLLGQAAQ